MSQQIMFSEASVYSLGGGVGMMSLPISGPMFLLEGVLPTSLLKVQKLRDQSALSRK